MVPLENAISEDELRSLAELEIHPSCVLEYLPERRREEGPEGRKAANARERLESWSSQVLGDDRMGVAPRRWACREVDPTLTRTCLQRVRSTFPESGRQSWFPLACRVCLACREEQALFALLSTLERVYRRGPSGLWEKRFPAMPTIYRRLYDLSPFSSQPDSILDGFRERLSARTRDNGGLCVLFVADGARTIRSREYNAEEGLHAIEYSTLSSAGYSKQPPVLEQVQLAGGMDEMIRLLRISLHWGWQPARGAKNATKQVAFYGKWLEDDEKSGASSDGRACYRLTANTTRHKATVQAKRLFDEYPQTRALLQLAEIEEAWAPGSSLRHYEESLIYYLRLRRVLAEMQSRGAPIGDQHKISGLLDLAFSRLCLARAELVSAMAKVGASEDLFPPEYDGHENQGFLP